jgi:hypothetical protein
MSESANLADLAQIEERLKPDDEDPNDNLNGQLDRAREVRVPYTAAEIEEFCEWTRLGGSSTEEVFRLLATVVALQTRVAEQYATIAGLEDEMGRDAQERIVEERKHQAETLDMARRIQELEARVEELSAVPGGRAP